MGNILYRVERLGALQVLLICAGLLGISALSMFSQPFPRLLSGPQDFTGFYLGAKHVGTPLLYDGSATKVEQDSATAINNPPMVFQYARFPFYAWLLRPLTILPHDHALVLWKLLALLGLAAAVFMVDASGKVGIIAISCSTAAVVMLQWGQDTWIALLLICAFFRFLSTGRKTSAGICIGVAIALKPHLFLPLIAAVSVAGGRKVLAGIAGSCTIAAALSFLVQGVRWPLGWLVIAALDAATSYTQQMPTILGIFGPRPTAAPLLYICTELAVITAAIYAAKRLPVDVATAVAILLGIIGSAHTYTYDLLLAIPCCLMIARRGNSPLALLLLTPAAQIPVALRIPVLGSLIAVAAAALAIIAPLTAVGRAAIQEHQYSL